MPGPSLACAPHLDTLPSQRPPANPPPQLRARCPPSGQPQGSRVRLHLCWRQCLSRDVTPAPQLREHAVHLVHSPHQEAVASAPPSRLLDAGLLSCRETHRLGAGAPAVPAARPGPWTAQPLGSLGSGLRVVPEGIPGIGGPGLSHFEIWSILGAQRGPRYLPNLPDFSLPSGAPAGFCRTCPLPLSVPPGHHTEGSSQPMARPAGWPGFQVARAPSQGPV